MRPALEGLAEKSWRHKIFEGEVFTVVQRRAYLRNGSLLSKEEATGLPINQVKQFVAEGTARRAVGDEGNDFLKAKAVCIADGRALKALSIKIRSRGKKKIQHLLMG